MCIFAATRKNFNIAKKNYRGTGMVPTNEAESIAELKKIEKDLQEFSLAMKAFADNNRATISDRATARRLHEFIDLKSSRVSDVITGLSQIFIRRNPSSVSAIVNELTKR
jgi:hypothetical protein